VNFLVEGSTGSVLNKDSLVLSCGSKASDSMAASMKSHLTYFLSDVEWKRIEPLMPLGPAWRLSRR